MSRKFEFGLMAALVVLGAVFLRSEWIPSFWDQHVEVAAERYDLELGEPSQWFSAWSIGDGQAFAVIAADPTGKKLSVEIKEPHYRFSRAGFGWLSYAASLGQDRLIPYGMALVGALALAGTLLLAVRLRDRLGVNAWFLVVNPALYIGFAGDTAEPLAILLLGVALATGGASAAIGLGLTRPSYLVALAQQVRPLVFGVGAAGALLAYSIIRFGIEQLIPAGGRLGLPFVAFIQHPSLAGWVLVGLAVATLVVGVRERDLAWVLAGLLVICLGSDVTPNIENAWRGGGMLPLLWAFGPGYKTGFSGQTGRIGVRRGVGSTS